MDRTFPARYAVAASVVAALALPLVFGALAWWLLPPDSVIGLDNTVEETEQWVRSWGAWGVAGSIALMVAHSFLPFPAEIIAIANGMLYGPLWGSVVTWVGAMLGAAMAFGLVRLLGRPFLFRMLSPHRLHQIERWSRERGGVTLLVSRLIPLIAFNLLNYGAALTGISWWTFLWATGIGILPLTILLAVVGDRVLVLPLWIWIALGVLALACWVALHRWRPVSHDGLPGKDVNERAP
jgi:uncharacterized membrane protein YdjX (TVP38/TMEM64 family)